MARAGDGADALVGTWRLVSFTVTHADGAVTAPYGADPVGILVYAADGHMGVQIAARERPRWAGERLEGGSAEECVAAAVTFRCYSGRYDRDAGGGLVRHHVETSFFPNRVGTTLVRRCALSDGGQTLTLTPVVSSSGAGTSECLVWRRPGAADA